MAKFDQEYWAKRYEEDQTGWDASGITEPLKTYFDQLLNKEIKILIPGCGNAYEAEYLFGMGFKNVFLCDWVIQPLEIFSAKNPEFPASQLLHSDFFQIKEDDFDLIVEQTFFCALDPKLRIEYVQKMRQLLKPGGKLAGLLFNFPLTEQGPPFGGSETEYQKLFSSCFSQISVENCFNSIKPRKGTEFFIKIS